MRRGGSVLGPVNSVSVAEHNYTDAMSAAWGAPMVLAAGYPSVMDHPCVQAPDRRDRPTATGTAPAPRPQPRQSRRGGDIVSM